MTWLDRTIKSVVQERINKALDERLPKIVHAQIEKRLRETPDQQLNLIGFRWACAFALREHWPDVDHKSAADWLTEYAGVPVGTKGYGWTFKDAQVLASEYVLEVGELA